MNGSGLAEGRRGSNEQFKPGVHAGVGAGAMQGGAGGSVGGGMQGRKGVSKDGGGEGMQRECVCITKRMSVFTHDHTDLLSNIMSTFPYSVHTCR